MLRLASVLALVVASRTAFAEPATPNVTVGVQPVMLVLPMVDASIEYSPTKHIGIAARVGYGRLFATLLSASFYDLGGEANVYLTRDFSGWHVGSELFWAWGDTSSFLLDTAKDNMSTSAERIVGVYGGYKWIGWKGMTATVQFGVGRLDQKQSPDGPISQVIPVANAFAGWSF
jgi:hypothetical protein